MTLSDSQNCMQMPDLERIRQVARLIEPFVVRTSTVPWPVPQTFDAEIFVKLELMQRTGSFKSRGAINTVVHAMQAHEGGAFPGVTAFSAGNHAIATAYAAHSLGTTATVVMPRKANAFRREQCEAFGAKLVFGDTIGDLLGIVKKIQAEEGRYLVHPFEGRHTIEGTATVGLELCDDLPEMDAVVVPVGGGGLIAGIASAVKQMQPNCRVIGVEPEGADGMKQSILRGSPCEHVAVDTIADSLGAPMHAPHSFSIVQKHVDEVLSVSDRQLRDAMRTFFEQMKLAVEPACAASVAALQGPLLDELSGRRVALIGCGSNIGLDDYSRLIGN